MRTINHGNALHPFVVAFFAMGVGMKGHDAVVMSIITYGVPGTPELTVWCTRNSYPELGARLAMLVLHDDAKREYAHGTAQGLPDTKIGHFIQALYDELKNRGWVVISMKNDWKRIFPFEKE